VITLKIITGGDKIMKKKIWTCKIGEIDTELLPDGADAPMRAAVEDAYEKLTGQHNHFCFSGWGGKLTDTEREIVKEK